MQKITLTESQVKLLLSFAPKETAEELPKGLDVMFYHTLSYERDLKICQDIDEIRKLVENANT